MDMLDDSMPGLTGAESESRFSRASAGESQQAPATGLCEV